MKRVLTFTTTPEWPGGGLLLQLAVTLRQLNITPECLTWMTSPPDGILQVRLVLSAEDKRWLPAVADRLRESPGVCNVQCLSVPDPLSVADGAPPGKDRSFTD